MRRCAALRHGCGGAGGRDGAVGGLVEDLEGLVAVVGAESDRSGATVVQPADSTASSPAEGWPELTAAQLTRRWLVNSKCQTHGTRWRPRGRRAGKERQRSTGSGGSSSSGGRTTGLALPWRTVPRVSSRWGHIRDRGDGLAAGLRVSCGSRRAVVTGLRSASNLERRRPLGCSSQSAAAARWPLGVFLRLSSE